MIEIILIGVSVFMAIFFVDILWVFYIKYVSKSDAIRASIMAVMLYIFSAVAIIAYTSNTWYLIPASIGAFFGTYTAIKLHDYLETKQKEKKN